MLVVRAGRQLSNRSGQLSMVLYVCICPSPTQSQLVSAFTGHLQKAGQRWAKLGGMQSGHTSERGKGVLFWACQ